MSYYIDANSTSLTALHKRLKSSDLIPSQEPLLVDLTEKILALSEAGIENLADLRVELVNLKKLTALSQRSDIDVDYLQLMRRTINGFFPKPRTFKSMKWLDRQTIQIPEQAGIKNTRRMFDACEDGNAQAAMSDENEISELGAISDLCRVQWVSPGYARALVAAGFKTASDIAKADPEKLAGALEDVNASAKYYRGKVGLRDVRRLVDAAKYVP